MRGSEKLLLVMALTLPLLVVTVVWPKFFEWAGGGPGTEVAGASATRAPSAPSPTASAPSAATPRITATPGSTAAPTATTTPSARATAAPARSEPGASAAVQPTSTQAEPAPTAGEPAQTEAEPAPPAAANPAPAPNAAPPPPPPPANPAPPAAANAAQPAPAAGTGDPRQTVATFYALVGQHRFDSAAQLWSPHMLAAFPPDQNITQRFRQTQQLDLRRADVVALDPGVGQATVAVDLVELNSAAGRRHYVGTWRLVHGRSGWLLDQPDLSQAP